MVKTILTALAVTLAVFGTSATVRAQTPPTTPGMTAQALANGTPLHVLAAKGNPYVHVEKVTLPADVCDQLAPALPPAQRAQARESYCTMLHYSFHVNHLPMPSGRDLRTGTPVAPAVQANLPSGWEYWSNDDELTDPTGGYVWSANEWSDGDDNGLSVWDWHNTCTPGGTGVAINDCFVLFNGGPPPYYGLQLGMDICTGLVTQWVSVCTHHGQRRWIDDQGIPTTYYAW